MLVYCLMIRCCETFINHYVPTILLFNKRTDCNSHKLNLSRVRKHYQWQRGCLSSHQLTALKRKDQFGFVENGIMPDRSPVSGRGSTITTNQHRSGNVDGHRTSRHDRVGSDGGQHSIPRDTSRRHPVVSGGHRSTKQNSSHSTRCVPPSSRKH